jgi:hypothetical protein
MKRALQGLGHAAMALLVVLALFVAPVCNTLCAAPSHCPAEAIASSETNSDSCHHVVLSSDSFAVSHMLTADTTCSQPDRVAAIVDVNPRLTEDRADRQPAFAVVAISFSARHTGRLPADFADRAVAVSPAVPIDRSTILRI